MITNIPCHNFKPKTLLHSRKVKLRSLSAKEERLIVKTENVMPLVLLKVNDNEVVKDLGTEISDDEKVTEYLDCCTFWKEKCVERMKVDNDATHKVRSILVTLMLVIQCRFATT